MEEAGNKVGVRDWSSNSKLVHEVERAIALRILREARRAGISPGGVKRLIELLIVRG